MNQILDHIGSCAEYIDQSDVLKGLIEHEICHRAKKLVIVEENAFTKNFFIENAFGSDKIEIISVQNKKDE